MPYASNDGVGIHYEETGTGTPLVFLHEFFNDHSGWDAQVGHFARGYRCVTIDARGYPPSDAPEQESAYGQDIFTADVLAVLDQLGIGSAHFAGLSMGAYTALQVALRDPGRVLSVTAASGCSGGDKATREAFVSETMAVAGELERMDAMPAEAFAAGPTRIQLRNKDPRAWRRNVASVLKRSPQAAAMTLRRVQVGRRPIYEFEQELRALATPVLLMAGDEDESCLNVNVYLKRTMPSAQLVVLPGCGHVLNLEEPALFNGMMERFIAAVDLGAWRPRDPAALREGGGATAVGLRLASKATAQ